MSRAITDKMLAEKTDNAGVEIAVKGGPVEAEQILGDLLARARSFGVDTPLLAAAFTHLSVYQAGLQSAG